jgi:hypothetical protein
MVRLAALRHGLDVMPSPVKDRPGLLLRDPFRYSEDVLIVPPPLVPFLTLFDGDHDESDLRAALVRTSGDIRNGEVGRQLAEALRRAGFLEDEELERRREERHRSFALAAGRPPTLAGEAYPADEADLGSMLGGYLGRGENSNAPPPAEVFAVAAPHVSLEGGWRSYAAAYRTLPADAAQKTCIVLGTSHFGAPERFGLTRKPYRTPLGETTVDAPLVERVASSGGEAVVMEDYCHAIEHSIEFQVIFLQHLLGPAVRVLPILCGPFPRGMADGGRPEDDDGVARVLDALSELQAREGPRLFWVLGVDMAHIGRRYGDAFEARARRGPLLEIEQRDRDRLATVAAGDAAGFWARVREEGDELRWCGASALYTFLRAVSPRHGALLRYEQWNIDPGSVVSFAAMAFGQGARG